MKPLIWTLCVAIVLASCTNAVTPGTPAVPSNHVVRAAHPGRFILRIRIPKKRRHPRGTHPRYISPATQSITVTLSGPTPVNRTANLTPASTGCSSSLASTFCMLSIGGLAPGNYTGAIATYDQTGGNGNPLSENQDVSFRIVAGRSKIIGITLEGIPTAVLLVPDPASSLSGSQNGGFTLSKCGTDKVSIYGVDADDNIILGAGAPTPALNSDSSTLSIGYPVDPPNTFTLTRSTPPPAPASTVHLTATVTPGAGGGNPVSTHVAMTFNYDICGYGNPNVPDANLAARIITAGPDGRMWFTVQAQGIGAITTAGVAHYSTTTSSGPNGITSGPDGRLWFTESGGRIGASTTSGVVTEYSAGISGDPKEIAVGPDGHLWFTEFCDNQIGEIGVDGTAVEYSAGISASSQPYGIAAGPDGNLWFTESAGNAIGVITTSGTVLHEYSAGISPGSTPWGITAGPDGNLWFTESNFTSGNRIAKITTAGVVTEYSTGISSYAGPLEITRGPDGNLWFTESCGVGRITTDGTVTEFPNIGGSTMGISFGGDGNLWITRPSAAVILQMQ